MKKIILSLLVLNFSLAPLSSLFAWGPSGHRIIAEIAERNLNKKAKKQVKEILKGYPMAYWSSWADNLRSDTTDRWKHTYVWHYVNIPGDLQKEEAVNALHNIEQENVYRVIPQLCEKMKNGGLSDEEKSTTLYFLIHLLGDLHQPMHIGRAEDLGGNKITVYWFGTPTNIHAVWDDSLINYEKYSYTEYTDILNRLSPKEKEALQSGTIEDWLFDTYQISNEIYSSIKNEDKLSYSYPYKYKRTVELQLQRAGLRLAAVLNSIFK